MVQWSLKKKGFDKELCAKKGNCDRMNGTPPECCRWQMDTTPSDEYFFGYPRRGVAVIINNITFMERTHQAPRQGADYDTHRLEETFKLLGFDVRSYTDMTTTNMLKILEDVAKEDHSQNDCFVCAISSHGDYDMYAHLDGASNDFIVTDIVYGTDGILQLRLITDIFQEKYCPSLASKPKLFFIQACRGEAVSKSAVVSDGLPEVAGVNDGRDGSQQTKPEDGPADNSDVPSYIHDLPIYRDYLLAYSTPPGFFSFRRGTGSWFITTLCDVLSKHSDRMDLMQMLVRVNHDVAYLYKCNKPSNRRLHRRQIVPWIASMLTKDVHFRPKESDAVRIVFV